MTRTRKIPALVALLLVLVSTSVAHAGRYWVAMYRQKGTTQWEKGPAYLYFPDQKDDSSRSKSLAWQYLRDNYDPEKFEFDVVHQSDELFADPKKEQDTFDRVREDQEKEKKKYPEKNNFELARLHYEQWMLRQKAQDLSQTKAKLDSERDRLVKEGLALIKQEPKTPEEKRAWEKKREELRKQSAEYKKQKDSFENKRDQLEKDCREYQVDCDALITKAAKDKTIPFVQIKPVDFKAGLTGTAGQPNSAKQDVELDGTRWRDSEWAENPDTYMTFVKNSDGKNYVTYHYIVPQGTETGKRASNLRGYWTQNGDKVIIESHIERGDSRYWQLKGTIKGDRILPDSDSDVQWTWVRMNKVNK